MFVSSFNRKSILTLILLFGVGLFFWPGTVAWGQGPINYNYTINSEPTVNSTPTTIVDYYTERLRTGTNNPNQNFDQILYNGDREMNRIGDQLNQEQLSQYQNTRQRYLEERQATIEANDYDPTANTWLGFADNHYGTYASIEYMELGAAERLKGIDSEIEATERLLENDPGNQELIGQLADLRERRAGTEQSIADAADAGAAFGDEIAAAKNNGECWTVLGGINPGNCFALGAAWIGNFLTFIFGSLLYVASRIFDLSVNMSISNIGGLFNSEAVRGVWQTMRDLANLSFVFILLYIALGTIFDFQAVKSGTKRLVVNVIIVALLVNFSGFFVRVVVDATNILAYEFYSEMGGAAGGVTGTQTIGKDLMQKLRLDKYLVKEGETSTSEPQIEHLSITRVIAQTLGNIFIILTTAFVLLVASLLFVIRTIWLLFLYIISPVAVAATLCRANTVNISIAGRIL